MKIMAWEITEKQLAAWWLRQKLEDGSLYYIDVPLTDKQHEEVCGHITKLTNNLSARIEKIINGKVDDIENFIEEKKSRQDTSEVNCE